MRMTEQAAWLLLLALPVASVSWTVTHEEILREAREYCVDQSKACARLYKRKFFYVLTCEYCFSHYVALFFTLITGFRLLVEDWRGLLIGWLSVVWIANFYMSLFGRMRLDIRSQRVDIAKEEKELQETGAGTESPSPK